MLLWAFMCRYLLEYLFSILLGIYLGVGSLGHMLILCFLFWKTDSLFSTVAASFCISTNSAGGFQFLHILANSVISPIFDYSHSREYEVVSHSDFFFDLHFFDDWWCLGSFHVLIGHSCIFFEELSIQIFCPC